MYRLVVDFHIYIIPMSESISHTNPLVLVALSAIVII